MQNQEDSRSLKNRKKEEIIVVNLLRLSGALSIFTTLGIISILAVNSIPFFDEVGFVEFFTGLKLDTSFYSSEFWYPSSCKWDFSCRFYSSYYGFSFWFR